jgi:hypothetical protein
LGILDGLEE